MTFVAYARARRMGLAIKQIKEGQTVIDAQLSSGYESGSGFRDAFSRIMGTIPSKSENHKVLKASWIDTPLGPMLVIADDKMLHLLEFVDRRGLEKEIERLRKKTKLPIIPGKPNPAKQIEIELEGYFSSKIQEFKTPLLLIGSPFQKRVWEELQKIPKGETRSYAEIAVAIGKPSAYRAVALANGANQFAIVIPCHRVINSNGDLGGYGGGIKRKEWLLKHERN
jgi:AraC family transcriptional regulator of adaptative response/methylated-DNA-[protein]-cysteine methyltransferase